MQNAASTTPEKGTGSDEEGTTSQMTGTTHSYGYRRELPLPFADAVERTYSALKTEGFGVLTEIDLKKKFKEKLDVDFRNYVILGACNPSIAFKSLQEEIDLGLLLPCNVIVYEQKNGSAIAAIDARSMLAVTGNPGLVESAELINEKLRRAVDAV